MSIVGTIGIVSIFSQHGESEGACNVPLREQTGGSGAAGSEWEVCRAILIII